MKFIVTPFRTLAVWGLILFAGAASAAEPITDFPKALATAKAQGKPMFIYLFDSL